MEQAAADHARAYGMDDAFFKGHHTAFLVGKQAAQGHPDACAPKKLTFVTACEPCKKGSMKRLTRILDEAGKECALMDSRWIMVDTDRRVHPAPALLAYARLLERGCPEGELPQLVHKAKELTCAGSRTASYSMCDLNGHINNSLYLDIACDALPQEVVEAGPLKFVSVKYHREIRWAVRSRCFMRPRPMAGMWWAAGKSTPLLSATWNLQNKSRKITKYVTKNYEKLLQNGNKRVTIWLQKGQ